MSNTYRHKSAGKYKQKVISYKDEWDRSNNELGEFRHNKKQLEEKIFKKELINIIKNNSDELTEKQYYEEATREI